MKKIISIITLVVLAMSFSFTALAAENANVFTVSTDVDTVAAGDAVYVTIDLEGDFTNVAVVQYSIKFDDSKFSAVTTGRAPWCFDKTWYDSTKDGNTENLGYINTPSVGASPANQLNVGFISTDGYYIDDAGALYGDGKSTVAGKIKFTAKADVATIDASCFELLNAKVLKEDGTAHDVTVNQIAVEEPAPAGNKMVALANTGAVESLNDDGWQKGQGIAATFNVADIKDFTAMNWKLTCNNIAAPKYAKVDNFAELIAAIGEESTVQFVATFVVNAIENEVETIYDITEVVAGFTADNGATVVEFTAPAAAN